MALWLINDGFIRTHLCSILAVILSVVQNIEYRRKVLVGNVEIRLKELLYEKTDEIDVQIAKLEIMPDHIHAFVKTRSINAPHYIVRQLKGYTARVLRLELPHLLKMPYLRTRSYYCESVGHISEKTIMKYIEEQKNK